MMTEPAPFEVYEEGVYLHGTKAVLKPEIGSHRSSPRTIAMTWR